MTRHRTASVQLGTLHVPVSRVEALRAAMGPFGNHLTWHVKIGNEWVDTSVHAGKDEEQMKTSMNRMLDALGWYDLEGTPVPPGPWPG